MDAFRAIEETPGSTQERRQLKSLFSSQALAITTESEFVGAALKSAETAYLEADADAILSQYERLDRSDDFDI